MIKKKKTPEHEEVFTLLVCVGRTKDVGLPRTSLGAGILCFTLAQTEEEAVQKIFQLLKQS